MWRSCTLIRRAPFAFSRKRVKRESKARQGASSCLVECIRVDCTSDNGNRHCSVLCDLLSTRRHVVRKDATLWCCSLHSRCPTSTSPLLLLTITPLPRLPLLSQPINWPHPTATNHHRSRAATACMSTTATTPAPPRCSPRPCALKP